jgi:hypothetical protein
MSLTISGTLYRRVFASPTNPSSVCKSAISGTKKLLKTLKCICKNTNKTIIISFSVENALHIYTFIYIIRC